jgi:hypothetical protein
MVRVVPRLDESERKMLARRLNHLARARQRFYGVARNETSCPAAPNPVAAVVRLSR